MFQTTKLDVSSAGEERSFLSSSSSIFCKRSSFSVVLFDYVRNGTGSYHVDILSCAIFSGTILYSNDLQADKFLFFFVVRSQKTNFLDITIFCMYTDFILESIVTYVHLYEREQNYFIVVFFSTVS